MPKKFAAIVSIEGGKPTGLFHYVYKLTAGGNVGAKFNLSKKISFTATAGYLEFFLEGGKKGIAYVPVLVGVQYYFIPKAFLALEGGGAFPTYSTGLLACAVPAIGYQITDRLSADINYTGFGQYGVFVGGLNLRASYRF